jgi:hypothetical protein
VTHRTVKAPRGKYRGTRIDKPATDDSEHFMPCPNCGAPIDMRDLGQVLEHDTPMHIEQGRRQKQAAIKAAQAARSRRAGR